MRADVLTDAANLAGIEVAWWDLFHRVPEALPFASPAWLLPWWESFAPGALFVIALWDDGRLVGLAPLYTEDGAMGRRLLPLGVGLTDKLDFLVDPDHATAVGVALGALLGARRGAWDCWSAEEAPPGATVLALPDPPGWRSALLPHSACPVLALPPGDLRYAIPARQWRKWQMARHRAARRDVSIVPGTAESLADDLGHLVRLHGARWRSRGEPGVLDDPRVRRFHDTAAPALMVAGLLRLWVLRFGEVVAGVYYGFTRGDRALAYLGGFDPAFAFESPGTLTIGTAIEAAAADGVRSFDFLRGQEAYKYAWGAVDVWTQRRTFEPIP